MRGRSDVVERERPLGAGGHFCVCRSACAFITAGPIIKVCAGGGRGTVKDMCYEVRRAEACVDYFAHHALVNARERDFV
jgi:hypothetical protein